MTKVYASALITTCPQLLNLYFPAQKIKDFLILAGGWREPNNWLCPYILIQYSDISQWKSAKKNQKWVELEGKIWPNLTTENNINEVQLTWSVLPQENQIIQSRIFMELSNQTMWFLQASITWNSQGFF